MKETIKWRSRSEQLPPVDGKNFLGFGTVMVQEIPEAFHEPFCPVLFVTDEGVVIPGRFFLKKVRNARWYSVQGLGFSDKEVSFWADMPTGPKLTESSGPR